MSPYRAPAWAPPEEPSTAQGLRFFFDPMGACQRWQWARRRLGGRWTPVIRPIGDEGGAFTRAWKQVLHCPLTWPRHSPQSNHNLFLHFGADHNGTIDDHFATVDEHGRCACEVYPVIL